MAAFFLKRRLSLVNISVYSDESGVFDKVHNDYFVFGGLIVLGKEQKELWSRKYAHAEAVLRKKKMVSADYELKATRISNAEKGKLFRSLNGCYKFGVIIREKQVLERIYKSKKDKQRYLDYAYKIAVKRAFENLIKKGVIRPEEIEQIHFFVDEHTTATNGKYELRESLEQEFKYGTYNYNYMTHYPPIFPDMKEVRVNFCNSESKLLIRAADIVENKIYHLANRGQWSELNTIQNLTITYLP